MAKADLLSRLQCTAEGVHPFASEVPFALRIWNLQCIVSA